MEVRWWQAAIRHKVGRRADARFVLCRDAIDAGPTQRHMRYRGQRMPLQFTRLQFASMPGIFAFLGHDEASVDRALQSIDADLRRDLGEWLPTRFTYRGERFDHRALHFNLGEEVRRDREPLLRYANRLSAAKQPRKIHRLLFPRLEEQTGTAPNAAILFHWRFLAKGGLC
jgi:hypothetical protein